MTMNEMEQMLLKLSEDVSNISSTVSAMKIDNQLYLKKKSQIAPGIYTKISCDSNGLIVKGESLDSGDIPQLQIDKIIGLKSELDKKLDNDSYDKMICDIIYKLAEKERSSDKRVSTGVRVFYDHEGHVVQSCELVEDDIPTISMDKIKGLTDEFNVIKHQMNTRTVLEEYTIRAGMYPKISYDNKGRVTGGSELDINDMPEDLLVRLNVLESKIPELASQKTVNTLLNDISKRVESNTKPVKSGTYSKVHVDNKGLVTGGSELTVKDLPTLGINDIYGLKTELLQKVDRSEYVDLNNTVSALVSSMDRIGDAANIKNTLEMKANDSDVRELKTRIDRLERLMNNIISNIPSDLIKTQLSQLRMEVNTLSARLSPLERKSNAPI